MEIESVLEYLAKIAEMGAKDKLIFGTPSKEGQVEITGDYSDLEAFRTKLKNAKRLRWEASQSLTEEELTEE